MGIKIPGTGDRSVPGYVVDAILLLESYYVYFFMFTSIETQ